MRQVGPSHVLILRRECVHLHFLIKGTLGWNAVWVAVLHPHEAGLDLDDISQITHQIPEYKCCNASDGCSLMAGSLKQLRRCKAGTPSAKRAERAECGRAEGTAKWGVAWGPGPAAVAAAFCLSTCSSSFCRRLASYSAHCSLLHSVYRKTGVTITVHRHTLHNATAWARCCFHPCRLALIWLFVCCGVGMAEHAVLSCRCSHATRGLPWH